MCDVLKLNKTKLQNIEKNKFLFGIFFALVTLVKNESRWCV